MEIFLGIIVLFLIIITVIYYVETGDIHKQKDIASMTTIICFILIAGMFYIKADKFTDIIITKKDYVVYVDTSDTTAKKNYHCQANIKITNRWSVMDEIRQSAKFLNTTCDKVTIEQIKQYIKIN